jgi:hypothetical protein
VDVPSPDAVRPLELVDIGHDCAHVVPGQPLDRRHVPETPVVGPHAPGHRTLERFVVVMPGLVEDVDQRRRNPVLPGGVPAVAGAVVGCVGLLPELRLRRKDVRKVDRCDRRPAVGAIVGVADLEVAAHADGGSQTDQNHCPAQ